MPTYLSPGVYVEEVSSGSRPIEGVGTAVAAFVGRAQSGPHGTPTLVSNWAQFTAQFGEFMPGAYLAHSVYGYFQNGGGNCYVIRVGGAMDDAGTKAVTAAPEVLVGRARFRALDPATRPGSIVVEVTDAGGEAPTEDMFKVVIKRDGQPVEEFDRAVAGRGKQNLATMLNPVSTVLRVEDAGSGPVERLPNGEYTLTTPSPEPAPRQSLSAEDYVGAPADRTGFGGLEAVEQVTMLCLPDLMSAAEQGLIDAEAVKAVQLAAIAHCELMGDRLAILDPPPDLNAQQVLEWRRQTAGYDSKFATLYWPWIRVMDPSTGRGMMLPPSGHVAGVWGRNDDTRGVHKAPANEVIRGAITVGTQITRTEQGLLNPVGVNCIRSFPAGGVRVYGARTLSQTDPEWRYVNVRRLFCYLEKSILNGTEWVVFEPNDEDLWAKIRRTISAFLVNEWRKGALFGLTPDDAFYVKCDSETNPSESIDAGMVVCEIGVAPVKPAEFVVFRLSQFSGGTSLVAE